MSLTETQLTAWAGSSVTSRTNTITSVSFTPAANSLMVVATGCGNATGVTATGVTVTDNSGDGVSWTQLVRKTVAGSADASVWVKDAGSSPVGRTVTVTMAPSTMQDVGLTVRQFTGAAPAASQTGATNTNSGNVATVSVTPTATGSQIVGAFGDTGTTVTANSATTLYGQTNDTVDGAGEGAFEGNTLTTAGTAQVLGYTATQTGSALAAAEILAAAGGTATALADSGAGADAIAVPAAVPLAESGAGADTLAVPGPGSGTGGSSVPGLAVPGLAVPGQAVAATGPTAAALAESGTGAEALAVPASVPLADAGSAADTLTIPGQPSLHDAGTGAESLGVPAAQPLAESGSGSEALAFRVSLADSAAGADSLTVFASTAPHSADTGYVVESAFYAHSATADPAQGAESAQVRLSAADRATAGDAPAKAWPSSGDAGKAADRAASAWPHGADTGHGGEAVKAVRLPVSPDYVVTTDHTYDIGIWLYLPIALRFGGKRAEAEERAAALAVVAARLPGQQSAVDRLAAGMPWLSVTRRVSSADAARAGEKARAGAG